MQETSYFWDPGAQRRLAKSLIVRQEAPEAIERPNTARVGGLDDFIQGFEPDNRPLEQLRDSGGEERALTGCLTTAWQLPDTRVCSCLRRNASERVDTRASLSQLSQSPVRSILGPPEPPTDPHRPDKLPDSLCVDSLVYRLKMLSNSSPVPHSVTTIHR